MCFSPLSSSSSSSSSPPSPPPLVEPVKDLRFYHRRFKRQSSARRHAELQQNPQDLVDYHAVADRHEGDDFPRHRIQKELDSLPYRRVRRVIDLGCGRAHLATYFQHDPRFDFVSVDHVALPDVVVPVLESSMADLKTCEETEADHQFDVVVLCMALWGPEEDVRANVAEAYRLLRTNGELWIADTTRHATHERDHGPRGERIPAEVAGNRLREWVEAAGFVVECEWIETYCLFRARCV
jgi:SAM-dependent methyltransferase